jgi:hypothetical protein
MNMQFLNVSNVRNVNTKTNNDSVQNIFQMRRFFPQQMKPITETKNEIIQDEPEKKRMIWGPAIWFLFHTLAEKIKVESFSSIRSELLNNIYAISVNLPCPVCATHAKEYLDKINFNTIQTKEQLKMLLFHFHNDVNKRKNFPQFSRDELDEKYSKANTVNIIHNFMYHFQDRIRSPKLIANDLQRQRIALLLKEWFTNNINHFEFYTF